MRARSSTRSPSGRREGRGARSPSTACSRCRPVRSRDRTGAEVHADAHASIVIGSGIAGLFTALLRAPRAACRACCSSPRPASRKATPGTRRAASPRPSATTTPRAARSDTLVAGAGLCDRRAVRVLTSEAAERVRRPAAARRAASTREDGGLALGREAAHSARRMLHAGGDATGAAHRAALAGAVRRRAASTVRERTLVAELIVEGGARVDGVRALDGGGDEPSTADARRAGHRRRRPALPPHHQSRRSPPATASRWRYRAGAAVADLEFFQFHPTALAPPGAPRFLISEAVRGEGAVLRNPAASASCRRYDPRAELAPRDVVARSDRAARWRATGCRNVLARRHPSPAGEVAARASRPSTRYCREQGCDPARADPRLAGRALHDGRRLRPTSGAGRRCPACTPCGEIARTGVHGANRLASNSLLEGVVFARARRPRPSPARRRRRAPASVACPTPEELAPAGPGAAPRRLEDRCEALMWDEAGSCARGHGLERARAALRRAAGALACDGAEVHETANLAPVGWVMAEAALRREESRGAHYRVDYPAPRAAWRRRQSFVLPSSSLREDPRPASLRRPANGGALDERAGSRPPAASTGARDHRARAGRGHRLGRRDDRQRRARRPAHRAAVLLAKQAGVLCGGRVFAETLTLVDPAVTVDLAGAPTAPPLDAGDVVATRSRGRRARC